MGQCARTERCAGRREKVRWLRTWVWEGMEKVLGYEYQRKTGEDVPALYGVFSVFFFETWHSMIPTGPVAFFPGGI